MNIAVIGGTRHIGPHIIDCLLEAGHEISVYNRGQSKSQLPPGVGQVVFDRTEPGQLREALKTHKPDAVVDTIAFKVDDVEEVVSALPDLRHYVFCGSTVIYGIIGKDTPAEDYDCKDSGAYGEGKIACEKYMAAQAEENGFRFTSLRMANPVGPGDDLLYLTGRESLFLDRMRQGKPIIIPGDGSSRMHSIDVRDVGRAFTYVLEREACFGNCYNLAGDEIMTLDEYFGSIARVLGVELVAKHIPKEWFRDNEDMWADWNRNFTFGHNWVLYESAFDISALRETGFTFETDHDTSVARHAEWLDANNLRQRSTGDDDEELVFAAYEG